MTFRRVFGLLITSVITSASIGLPLLAQTVNSQTTTTQTVIPQSAIPHAVTEASTTKSTIVRTKLPTAIIDWCNSVKDMTPFTQPADGTICGQAFKVGKAVFTSSSNNFSFDELQIASPDASQTIIMKFNTGYTMDELPGKTFTFTPQSSNNMPTIKVICSATNSSEFYDASSGLGLKLTFGTYEQSLCRARSLCACRVISVQISTVLFTLQCKFEFGGFERSYSVHLPANYDSPLPLPLVMIFHGAGGTAELAAEITGWRNKADSEGFIAVFPDGVAKEPSRPQSFLRNPQFWNAGIASSGATRPDDVAFCGELIDKLQTQYSIDSSRIFATGFSNGAAMAWRLGVEMSEQIAAIGPVAGFLAIPEPRPSRAVPALIIACEDDPMIPLDGGEVKDIWSKEARNRPSLRLIVKKYAEACGCSSEPVVLKAGEGVTHYFYSPLVDFYTIADAGHTYPGGSETLSERMFGKRTDRLNATELLWEFFKAKQL